MQRYQIFQEVKSLQTWLVRIPPIPFSVQQIGCGVSCDEFLIEIVKEDKSQIWSYSDSLDGKLFEEYPKMLFQKNVGPSRPFVANHPGEYTVKVSSDNYFIEKKFTVSLLDGMIEYEAMDYYQYVQIQDFLQSCMQVENTSEEQCDSEVRKRIVYPTQTQFEKPYFTVNLKDICIHLDLICSAHHPFAGIEKDGHIVVEHSHEWDDEYYEFIIENNSIKSVWYSGDNFER